LFSTPVAIRWRYAVLWHRFLVRAASFWSNPVKSGPLLLCLIVIVAALYVIPRFIGTSSFVADTKSLEISNLIGRVRCELAKAEVDMHEQGRSQLFELQDFELEINFVVKNSGSLEAEVVGVGGNLEAGNERAQKLKLRWQAKPLVKTATIPATDRNSAAVMVDGQPVNEERQDPCQEQP
jgi:hypothetical protein